MTNSQKQFVKNTFGVNSYLFNELSKGTKSDLEDDEEDYETYMI